MKIQDFIEKGIKGGWSPDFIKGHEGEKVLYFYDSGELRQWVFWALLQPDLWEQVGRVEGWAEPELEAVGLLEVWKQKFIGMPRALAEGKTIEQYLETL